MLEGMENRAKLICIILYEVNNSFGKKSVRCMVDVQGVSFHLVDCTCFQLFALQDRSIYELMQCKF